MSEYGEYDGEGRHHHHHHHHRREEEERREEVERREERRYEEYEGRNPGYYETSYPSQAPAYGYAGTPAEYPQSGYSEARYTPSEYPPAGYQQPGYGGYPQPGYPPQPSPYGTLESSYYSQEGRRPEEPYVDYEAQAHKHKRNEHLGEVGALAAGAFALYESHEVKVDPENAGRHRIEESIAGVGAVGAGGYALYEHQKVKKDHRLEEESSYREEGRFGAPYGNQYEGRQEALDYRDAEEDYEAEARRHKKKEHRGELGALAAGAFALYEGHEAKVDPEHARRHRLEEEMAGAGALGAGGYSLYEHQQGRHDRKHEEREEKHHHGFFS